MLVVVDVVSGVAVGAVDVVDVVVVRDGGVPAPIRVHVHVARVGQVVPDEIDRAGVDMILVHVVDVAVMEEVEVVLVGNGGVPAEAVVGMRVLGAREAGRVGHRGHGSPNGERPQTMVQGLKPRGARQTQTGYGPCRP